MIPNFIKVTPHHQPSFKPRKLTDPTPKLKRDLAPRTEMPKCKLAKTESYVELSRQAYRLKRDLIEDDRSKKAFNRFLSDMKEFEKLGLNEAVKSVLNYIFDLPHKIHWKVLQELADFAK